MAAPDVHASNLTLEGVHICHTPAVRTPFDRQPECISERHANQASREAVLEREARPIHLSDGWLASEVLKVTALFDDLWKSNDTKRCAWSARGSLNTQRARHKVARRASDAFGTSARMPNGTIARLSQA